MPAVGGFDRLYIVPDTAFTLDQSYNNKVISFTAGGAVTVTVPPGLAAGFRVDMIQGGTGTVTLSAASGVSVNRTGAGSLATSGQYAGLRLLSRDVNAYIVEGMS